MPDVTDAEILAGCRVVLPSMFRHGLEPLSTDGPKTVAQILEVRDLVRRILEAANEVRKSA